MFYLTTSCSVCGGGACGVRRCSDETTLVVMCDECDAVWTSADLQASRAIFPTGPDFLLPGSTVSVAGPVSRWATASEIDEGGWRPFVTGQALSLDDP